MPRNRAVFSREFLRVHDKLDSQTRIIVDKRIEKILDKPELGKPMKNRLDGMERSLKAEPTKSSKDVLSRFYSKVSYLGL